MYSRSATEGDDTYEHPPGWLGERLDVGWAIDVLHPRALQTVAADE